MLFQDWKRETRAGFKGSNLEDQCTHRCEEDTDLFFFFFPDLRLYNIKTLLRFGF